MFGLIPYENRRNDPHGEGMRLMDEFERRFLDRTVSAGRTDISDCGDHFMLETELPGFEREEINVDVNGDVLSVRAERKSENGDCGDKNYICCERRKCTVSRAFDISGVDGENITAEYKNGLLRLRLPKKAEKSKARRLELN